MSCAECYYRGTTIRLDRDLSYSACDYILYTNEPRGCEVKGCDKFLKKPKDRISSYGCGSCIHFDNKCKVTGEDVWSCKPSCKKHYKKNKGVFEIGKKKNVFSNNSIK